MRLKTNFAWGARRDWLFDKFPAGMDARELKQYQRFKDEAQFLRSRCRDLEQELGVCRPELYRAYQKIDRLEQSNAKYKHENLALQRKLADLSRELKSKPKAKIIPSFVKANVTEAKSSRKPGRKPGHTAALRPRPEKIDIHQTVECPVDSFGKPSCRHCSACSYRM